MSAVILAFPAARRIGAIRKTAGYMASVNERQAEAHLEVQVRRLAESLFMKGLDPETVDSECRSYQAAVRAQLWRCILQPEGAA